MRGPRPVCLGRWVYIYTHTYMHAHSHTHTHTHTPVQCNMQVHDIYTYMYMYGAHLGPHVHRLLVQNLGTRVDEPLAGNADLRVRRRPDCGHDGSGAGSAELKRPQIRCREPCTQIGQVRPREQTGSTAEQARNGARQREAACSTRWRGHPERQLRGAEANGSLFAHQG